jgi:hypothetical protein
MRLDGYSVPVHKVHRLLRTSSAGWTRGSERKKKLTDFPNISARRRDEVDGDDDAQGLYCQDCYSKSIEGWVACCRCHIWAIKSCAVVDSDGDKVVHVGCQCVSKILKYRLLL